MNTELLQAIVNVVFKGIIPQLAPFIFMIMVIMFSDRLIELIYNAIGNNTVRRNRY